MMLSKDMHKVLGPRGEKTLSGIWSALLLVRGNLPLVLPEEYVSNMTKEPPWTVCHDARLSLSLESLFPHPNI